MTLLKFHNVAIVGGGPAGIAAGIYLSRAGIDCIVFERGELGGLLRNANLVENYPGFPDGLSGRELVEVFRTQMDKWKVKLAETDVMRVTRKGGVFSLRTDNGEYQSKFLIVATGTVPKTIELKGLQSIKGRKVFNEVVEIPNVESGQDCIIIGGGDAAFDYALNLASKGVSVHIVFRGKEPTCIPLLLERAKKQKNVHIHPRTVPESVREKRGKIVLNCSSEDEETALQGDYVLLACGRKPNVALLSTHLRYVVSGHDGGPEALNMFTAGDVRGGSHRQVGIAVGDGISVAMKIIDKIRENEEHGDTW